MCAVLRRPVSPGDAGRVSDERRAYLGDTQELHRRRPPAVACRQGHHVRLADLPSSTTPQPSTHPAYVEFVGRAWVKRPVIFDPVAFLSPSFRIAAIYLKCKTHKVQSADD